ncbi:MAG: protein phosphatase 2C domain-containing protein [bacterium]
MEMRANADSAYVIGAAHRVCQDYARCGRTQEGRPYAIVSDGCSGSPDTDVGARLLTLSCEVGIGRISSMADPAWWCWGAMEVIDLRRRLFQKTCWNLDPLAMDATLVFALGQRSSAFVSCTGDGVIAARDPGGALRIWEVEAPDGYPRYANYLVDDQRMAAVLQREEWVARGPDGEELRCRGVQPFQRTIEDAAVVAVFSDGVRSFLDADHQPIPSEVIVGELMAFKGLQGVFVQRRLQAFLRKAAQRGWRHDDDLSMGAVVLERAEGSA